VPLCNREHGRYMAYLVLHPRIDFVIDRKPYRGAHHQCFWHKGFLVNQIGRAVLADTAIRFSNINPTSAGSKQYDSVVNVSCQSDMSIAQPFATP
jgi:hypothetical protein